MRSRVDETESVLLVGYDLDLERGLGEAGAAVAISRAVPGSVTVEHGGVGRGSSDTLQPSRAI